MGYVRLLLLKLRLVKLRLWTKNLLAKIDKVIEDTFDERE